jgi:hypothetical protein
MKRVVPGVGAALVLVLSACTSDESDAASGAEPAASEGEQRPVDLVGEVSLEPSKAPAGTEVVVEATDLPSSTELDLVWVTAECRWVLEGEQDEEYHGRACDAVEVPLETLATDADGAVETSFVVPDDYGFAHDVLLIDDEGTVRNQALFDLEMQVSVTPESGPVGTPVTIEVKGMGQATLENQRTILYDNAYSGFLSAVTTQGTARAVVPATGQPGTHLIEIERGAYTFPYLNPAQSPRPDIPTFDVTFEVTEGDPVLPAPVEDQNPPPVPNEVTAPDDGEAMLIADHVSAPVETEVTLTGAGLPADADVVLNWYRIVGNRVGGQGWEERSVELGTESTDGRGRFEFSFEIPHDVGGTHRIEAVVDGDAVAETAVSITPAAEPIEVGSGPAGTDVEIQLTGVGWTETANIYTTVYDNGYVGYECGFNSQGDVTIPLELTGPPGWHFIDLYPAIYKGDEARGVDSFRIPQLTYEQDHPGEDLPAFHFAVHVDG